MPASSPRTACSPRSTRRRAGWRSPVASRCCSPTPSASSAACRTASSSRSSRRWRSPRRADYLVHVVDASAADPEGQIDAVREVLAEIDAAAVPELLVFNKADLAGGEAKRLVDDHPGSVAVSAVTGEGVDVFLRTLADRLRSISTVVELAVPYDRGDVLASIHREGEVVSTTDEHAHLRVRARPLRRVSGPAGGVRRRPERSVTMSGETAGFVPPPVPLRPAGPAGAARRSVRGWRRRPLDRHPDRPCPARRRDGAVDVGARARLPAEHRQRRAARRGAAVDAPPLRCRRAGSGDRSDDRQQGVRRHPATVAAPRSPDRDTVLYPAASYPTYEMGAILARAARSPCR